MASTSQNKKSTEREMLEKKGERQTQLEERPYLGESDAQEESGRAGGNLARKVGARDQEKRSFERPSPASRVRKSDEET